MEVKPKAGERVTYSRLAAPSHSIATVSEHFPLATLLSPLQICLETVCCPPVLLVEPRIYLGAIETWRQRENAVWVFSELLLCGRVNEVREEAQEEATGHRWCARKVRGIVAAVVELGNGDAIGFF